MNIEQRRERCKLYMRERRANSHEVREQDRLRAKRYRFENHNKVLESTRAWRRNNPDDARVRSRKFREANPDYTRQQNLRWAIANRAIRTAINAKRRAAKLRRTPSWLTREQLKVIAEHYTAARELTILTGIAFHVDHIIPLQGEFVSGLHVPWNLQILPYYENIAKKNKVIL